MKTLIKLLLKNNLAENSAVAELCLMQDADQFFLLHAGQVKQIEFGENLLLGHMTITRVVIHETELNNPLAMPQETLPIFEANQNMELPAQYHSLLRPLTDSDGFYFSTHAPNSMEQHSGIHHLADQFDNSVKKLKNPADVTKKMLNHDDNNQTDILKALDLL